MTITVAMLGRGYEVGIGQNIKAPLNHSAQLCASEAGAQDKAVMVENGQPFSTSPTTLGRLALRALQTPNYSEVPSCHREARLLTRMHSDKSECQMADK